MVEKNSNTYDEVRKQRVEENKKRFQDLGILSISKSLSQLVDSEKKQPKIRVPKPKPEKSTEGFEPRRSSRARNPVPSYRDDIGMEPRPMRKRSGSRSGSWEMYCVRPIEELKFASDEERNRAFSAAEEFQQNLPSDHPSFVKSMLRSHVYSCFWLGLPNSFCKKYLPKKEVDMVLVDEAGAEYDAKFLGEKVGLSGGWRGFALDHKLNDGDALVFELVEPDRFKIYIFRISYGDDDSEIGDTKETAVAKNESKKSKDPDSSRLRKSKKGKIVDESDEHLDDQKPQIKNEAASDALENPVNENGVASKKQKKRGRPAKKTKLEETEPVEDNKNVKLVLGTRKKPAIKFFRKRG